MRESNISLGKYFTCPKICESHTLHSATVHLSALRKQILAKKALEEAKEGPFATLFRLFAPSTTVDFPSHDRGRFSRSAPN